MEIILVRECLLSIDFYVVMFQYMFATGVGFAYSYPVVSIYQLKEAWLFFFFFFYLKGIM